MLFSSSLEQPSMMNISKPILQSFTVKTSLSINLENLVDALTLTNKINTSNRSGTVVALKYKTLIKGKEGLFKTKTGFKNACHLVIYYTLDKRQKKMIHIKITSIGTFQIVGVPVVDVEKVIYKVFLLLENLNKNKDILNLPTIPVKNRLEIVIVPILNNYMITLNPKIVQKIFQNSSIEIIQKFVKNKFLSFMVPNDSAIIIKQSYSYTAYSKNPIRYVVWNKRSGKTVQNIEYESYTTLLTGSQKVNATLKKYVTLRLYSTGKVLVSGFDELLISQSVGKFFRVCEEF